MARNQSQERDYFEPMRYYRQVRQEQGLSPRWAYTAVLQRYACNSQDYQRRYKHIDLWLKNRDSRKRDEMELALQPARDYKTEQLAAVADFCRDNGYGAARRDKLGIKAG